MQGDAVEIARELAAFASQRASVGGRVHVVGHSLGGAFVLRALEHGLAGQPGNAVLLGSPVNGSRAAHGASRFSVLRPLLGTHVLNELLQPGVRCLAADSPRAVGSIAGSRRLGFGQFFADFEEDNDGTVAVRETVIPGLADHLVMPHSHMGMLFADDVAAQIAHFLRLGRFEK
jgi:pimeloyl-ACP methyl ester carboxylesterase